MKIKHQLSIATLVMVGVFATGCSQQSADGGSQVSGSQQVAGGGQVSGGSQQQVEGGSQVSGSQQQVEAAAPVVAAPAPAPAPVAAPAPRPMPAPVRRAPVRHNPWLHGHPEAPKCAKTRSHVHKYPKTGARHHHRYACQHPRRAVASKPPVDVEALQRKLKSKGYYKGPIDGVVGPATRSALKRFMAR